METESKQRKKGEELPPEIWVEIGKRLKNRLDVNWFRSVCKTWRSYLAAPTRFPMRVPAPPTAVSIKFARPCFITEETLYRFDTKSTSDPNQMLMVLVEVDQGGKFHPRCFQSTLKEHELDLKGPWEEWEPERPKLSGFSFLSKTYAIHMGRRGRPKQAKPNGVRNLRLWPACNYVQKIVVLSSSSVDPRYARVCDLTVVALLGVGKLALWRPGDLNWNTDLCSSVYKDIITYNGNLYSIDCLGRAFLMSMNKDTKHTQVSPPLLTIPNISVLMRYVEALGQLYLLVSKPGSDMKIYKLIEQQKQWLEVDDLGDLVFIVLSNQTFSAPRDVIVSTGLMDLKYELKPHCISTNILVFSNRQDKVNNDGTAHCSIPLVSKPCIKKPWLAPTETSDSNF